MKCKRCLVDLEEKNIDESHDVPTYLWEGNRKGRKNQADKHGRHQLCKSCHDIYERELRTYLQVKAKNFAKIYFGEKEDDSISEF